MAEFAKTHDPKLVSLDIVGAPADGFAKGSYIEIEYMTPRFSSEVGSLGDVARIKSHDNRAKVKITLLPGSQFNDILAAKAKADRDGNTGVGPFQLKQINGRLLAWGQHSWITKEPKISVGDTISPREWEFEVAEMETTVGGQG